MKSITLISLSLIAFTALAANAQENPVDARSYANLERIIKQSDTLREALEPDSSRLREIRELYRKGENAPGIIEERNQVVGRLTQGTDELRELRNEFKESSKGLQMRMVMSSLGSAMEGGSDGIKVNAFSRYMAVKTRMDKNRKFTRSNRHLLLEEKSEFLKFEMAYKQKRRAMMAGAAAGLVVMIGAGAVFLRKYRRTGT